MATRDAIRRERNTPVTVKVVASTPTLDGDDIPLEARCNICLRRWYRPDDDPTADTLADFARLHQGMHATR